MDGMGQQLRGFTQTTQTTLEGLRGAVDERLAQAVAESRNGRGAACSFHRVLKAVWTSAWRRLTGADAAPGRARRRPGPAV